MGSVVRVVHLISVSAVPKYYLPASGDFCRGLRLRYTGGILQFPFLSNLVFMFMAVPEVIFVMHT